MGIVDEKNVMLITFEHITQLYSFTFCKTQMHVPPSRNMNQTMDIVDEKNVLLIIFERSTQLFSEWEDDQSNESYNARMTAETIHLLAQRSQVDTLKSLGEYFLQADWDKA